MHKIGSMEFTKLSSYPPGANPFNHDLSSMGTRLASNVMAMHLNHTDAPSDCLVLVDTETGDRVGIHFVKTEVARIKFRSEHEVDGGLFGLKFMEGGGYISDWLRKVNQYSVSTCTVPDSVARLILESVGLDYHSFGNKDFVRYTKDDEVTGHDDRPCISFLYKHDFRWAVYTLNL